MAFTPVTVQILTESVFPAGEQQGTLVPWPAGATSVTATGLMSDADVKDGTKTAQITLTESFDGGQTIARGPSSPWTGGILGKDGVTYIPPGVEASYASSGNPPTHASAIIAPNQPMSIGLKLTFN